jgi:hypothetical protein
MKAIKPIVSSQPSLIGILSHHQSRNQAHGNKAGQLQQSTLVQWEKDRLYCIVLFSLLGQFSYKCEGGLLQRSRGVIT